MWIYRGIAIEEGKEVSLENIGNSWSLSREVAESRASEMASFHGYPTQVVLEAKISEPNIDWARTIGQAKNASFAAEQEVVIKANQTFEIEIHVDGDYTEATATTQWTIDETCSEYEGDDIESEIASFIEAI
jgi:hypothetical protein